MLSEGEGVYYNADDVVPLLYYAFKIHFLKYTSIFSCRDSLIVGAREKFQDNHSS